MIDTTSPLELPGMLQAMDSERVVRSAAYLARVEHIQWFAVVPITLAQYSFLRLAGSPFLPPYGNPTEADLATFLWFLSPEFVAGDSPEKKRFIRAHCRRFVKPAPPRRWLPLYEPRYRLWRRRAFNAAIVFAELSESARHYIEEARQDAPEPPTANGIPEPDFYSDETLIIAALARNYGWSADSIWNLPLKQVFQYLKEIRHYNAALAGKPAMLSNRSEQVIDEYLEKVNRELKERSRN